MANRPSARDYAAGTLSALTLSIACMAIFIGIVFVAPRAAAALWLGVPVGTVVGLWAIHRRFPADTYVIGLAFVPIVFVLLAFAAFQVYWTVLGNVL